jgi:hypothetical protein
MTDFVLDPDLIPWFDERNSSDSYGEVVEARRSFHCENAVMNAVAKVKHESQRHPNDE